MNKKLCLALGTAALAAVMGTAAQAGAREVILPPAMVVGPAPVAMAYTYHYYPAQQVYFDPGRGIYFWYANGVWLYGPHLPRHIVLGPRYLTVPMHSRWPHHHHQEVYHRYPPGFDHAGPWHHR